jgi:hypothetical protein
MLCYGLSGAELNLSMTFQSETKELGSEWDQAADQGCWRLSKLEGGVHLATSSHPQVRLHNSDLLMVLDIFIQLKFYSLDSYTLSQTPMNFCISTKP